MKIEASFNGKEWFNIPFAKQLKVEDFINFLARHGNTYYRIENGPSQEVKKRNIQEQILMPGKCEICGSLTLSAKLNVKNTCVWCAYHPKNVNSEEEVDNICGF